MEKKQNGYIKQGKKENPPEFLKIFMKIENLTEEEMKYIAMIGLKFDLMKKKRKMTA